MATTTHKIHTLWDGQVVDGELWLPERPAAAGVLVFPAIHGITAYLREVLASLVDEGFAALAIDYWASRKGAPELSTPAQVAEAISSLDDPHILQSAMAALAYLAAHTQVNGHRLGTLGFCMGGMYAYRLAGMTDDIAAAVDFYGMIEYSQLNAHKPVQPLAEVAAVRAPLLAHYGELDALVPPAQVDALAQALAAHQKVYELYRYPGAGHAFHDHSRPSYRPVAAAEAWNRSMRFLHWYLDR